MFNGKDIIVSNLSMVDQSFYNTTCRGEAVCVDAGAGKEVGSRRITCTSPNSISEESTRALQDKEVGPLVKLYCGDAPAGENAQTAYIACASKVRDAYFNDCNSTGGSATSAMQTTSGQAAKCMAGKDLGTKVDPRDIETAVTNGRADKDKALTAVIKDIQTNNAQSDCEARIKKGEKVEWKNEACVEKTTTSKPTCTGGAIGWLLCPVANMMQIANELMVPQIENQLTMKPLTGGSATYNGTFKIWQTMVSIANLLLVIGFLVVIFSQATSVGLSAYGIKKMLPRIIAAAILINLSYFICAIAIDISNVIGASVKGVIDVGLQSTKIEGTAWPDFASGTGAVIIALFAVGAVVITGAVAYIVPIALMILMSLMAVFLGLALRKIIIILLIIVAPLAFAAMILPGTEGLFKKWQKSLTSLLVMYPVVMAILYGSMLVANIILATDDGSKAMVAAGASADTITQDVAGAGIVNVLLAYAVLGLGPGMGTYMYIKNQNKLFGMAANAVNKAGAGLRKASMGWANGKRDRSTFGHYLATRKKIGDTNAKIRAYDRIAGFGTTGAISKRIPGASRLPTIGMGSRARSMFNAQVAGMNNAAYAEEVKAEEERLSNVTNNKAEAYQHVRDLGRSGTASDVQMHAAAANLLKYKGGKSDLRALMRDQSWMTGVKTSQDSGNRAYVGLQRAALGDKAFATSHPDLEHALRRHTDSFLNDAANGNADNYLGANFSRSSPFMQQTQGEQGNGEDIKSWEWIADRPGQILATSHDHANFLRPHISYETAVAARESKTEFANSDPGIQSMINEIIAQHENQPGKPRPAPPAPPSPPPQTATAPGGEQFIQGSSGLFVPRDRR